MKNNFCVDRRSRPRPTDEKHKICSKFVSVLMLKIWFRFDSFWLVLMIYQSVRDFTALVLASSWTTTALSCDWQRDVVYRNGNEWKGVRDGRSRKEPNVSFIVLYTSYYSHLIILFWKFCRSWLICYVP